MSMSTTRRSVVQEDPLDTYSAAAPRQSEFDDASDDETRHGRIGRRESRLGLRNIFGRSRAAKGTHPPPHTIYGSGSASIRASMTRLGFWSDGQHSDAALSSRPSRQHLPATPEAPQPGQIAAQNRAPASKRPKKPRDAAVNWPMPPPLEALPQAIRHVTLPATTISADSILRLNRKKHGIGLQEEPASSACRAENEARGGQRGKERRKHGRNASVSADSLEWTSKIYMLDAQGHVLQYAADGHPDRLPDKILRLGPCSAAFATDAIPGRHWVLHVSSVAEADGISMAESRPLLSKIPFRMGKRSTSNLFMVFESAEDMEAWIKTLRGEIEKLGGKQHLSETGRPQPVESSQHHLLVQDSYCFIQGGAGHATATRDRAQDDDSTSNSAVSHDERQLDNLRENANRLSAISSGQRSIFTSTGSSPEPSPTRDGFACHMNDVPARLSEYTNAGARPRPNALDIAFRRQSTQVTMPFVEPRNLAGRVRARPPSACGTVLLGDGVLSPPDGRPTSNFSLPHSSNRRFSHARPPTSEADGSIVCDGAHEPSCRAATSDAPPDVRVAPTIPMVMDQPFPRKATPDGPTTRHDVSQQALPTKRSSQKPLRSTLSNGDALWQGPSTVSKGPRLVRAGGVCTHPRRLSSLGAMQKQDDAVTETGWVMPPAQREGLHDVSRWPPPAPRDDDTKTYLDPFLEIGGPQRRSVELSHATKWARHESILPEQSSRQSDGHGPPVVEQPPSAPLPRIPTPASSWYLQVDMTTKALLNRRSMPQLTEAPPPPTRALPPIPQKSPLRMLSP